MMLPSDFISRTQALLGSDYPLLENALQTEAPVSIRINKTKNRESIKYEQVPWCEDGYYLPKRLSFTFDPLFHAGIYYVQEASSMFLEQAIKTYITNPVKCLDLCAAPGGKSTHLLNTLPEGSLLVSNEIIKSRSKVLSENITKWGNPATIVTNNDPADFNPLTHFFDLIVTDVPCSGEGMFRKDPNSIHEWSMSNVNLCATRQKRILQETWNALKPGGILVYSTCTYNTEENEDNIHYIIEELGGEPLSLPVKEVWGITGALKYDYPVYRFFPHKTKGEGFFLAIVRKNEGEVYIDKLSSRKEKRKSIPLPPVEIDKWLKNPEKFTIERKEDIIQAFPNTCLESYKYLSGKLHIISAGIYLGELKGKDIQPAHSLAMSTEINTNAFNRADVNREEAINYLRKETLTLNQDKGYVLITYKGFPLGFVKQVGNRANNLYPQDWRIRSGYLPKDNFLTL